MYRFQRISRLAGGNYRSLSIGSDMQEKLQAAADRAKQLGTAGQEKLQEKFQAATDRAKELSKAGQEKFQEGADRVKELSKAGQQELKEKYEAGQEKFQEGADRVKELSKAGKEELKEKYEAGADRVKELSKAGQEELQAKFQAAADRVKQLSNAGQEELLKLYALFKQASIGDNTTKKPSMIDMAGSAKWKAWNALAGMTKEDAQKKYVEFVDSLTGNKGKEESVQSAPSATRKWKTLSVDVTGKIYKITLNRPDKKNAISSDMYEEIVAAMDESAKSDSLLTVFTGSGDYYCSGNDLSNFSVRDMKDLPKIAHDASIKLKRYIAAYIDHPKPLVALVNGPAIGIAVTVLGMFDLVYASDKATFETPFGRLGQAPEGCSSYTYPRIMGMSKAMEVLMFNRKLTAEEAARYGLVNEVFPSSSFNAETNKRLQAYAQLAPQNIVQCRKLIRDQIRKELHNANEAECTLSEQRWQSKEAVDAIMKFFNKSKM